MNRGTNGLAILYCQRDQYREHVESCSTPGRSGRFVFFNFVDMAQGFLLELLGAVK